MISSSLRNSSNKRSLSKIFDRKNPFQWNSFKLDQFYKWISEDKIRHNLNFVSEKYLKSITDHTNQIVESLSSNFILFYFIYIFVYFLFNLILFILYIFIYFYLFLFILFYFILVYFYFFYLFYFFLFFFILFLYIFVYLFLFILFYFSFILVLFHIFLFFIFYFILEKIEEMRNIISSLEDKNIDKKKIHIRYKEIRKDLHEISENFRLFYLMELKLYEIDEKEVEILTEKQLESHNILLEDSSTSKIAFFNKKNEKKIVVVKKLNFDENNENLENFGKEKIILEDQMMRNLVSPHIVSYLGCFLKKGIENCSISYVFEYIEVSLLTLIENSSIYPYLDSQVNINSFFFFFLNFILIIFYFFLL